jgi:predicted TIM-barrel fold metal-dependent hydrolase
MMDHNGVRAAALFPNLCFFHQGVMHTISSAEFQLECIRAYNDYQTDWTAPKADRFIPMAFIPYWDVDASVREIERCAAMGHRGIVTTGAPDKHGQPYLADRHWDPIWAAAQAHGLPVAFHAGGGDLTEFANPLRMAGESMASTYTRTSTSVFLVNGITLAELLSSGILPRFPNLKFVAVESGIGWVPFVLEACDYHWKTSDVSTRPAGFTDLPSEYFRRQVYVNYWFEDLQPWHVEAVGDTNILFETDFPHPTCLLGDDVAAAVARLDGLSQRTRQRILWENAASLYNLPLLQPASESVSSQHGHVGTAS